MNTFAEITLDVVYPRPLDDGSLPKIPPVDSTFVFGSVKPVDCTVKVNNIEAKIYPNGAFMAYVPLDKDNMTFKIEAFHNNEIASALIPFQFYESPPEEKLDYQMPALLEVIDPNAVIRYSANYGVYYMFPVQGAFCWADDIKANFFRIKLTDDDYAWIENRFVEVKSSAPSSIVSRVYSLQIIESENSVQIIIPVQNRPLHRVYESIDSPKLELYLYGLESHIDMIRFQTNLIRDIQWQQIDSRTLKLEIALNCQRIWGYWAQIDSSGYFVFNIRKPPQPSIEGLKIALDPGHGGSDFGAIGPTRLSEKYINLTLTAALAEFLTCKGIEVYLTRTQDVDVSLYDRIDSAFVHDANLMISIHNNALADGIDPFQRRGAGVYYYHPHSRDFAHIVHTQLLQYTGLQNDGCYYANLAIPRYSAMPTILMETAYIMHPQDEVLLKDKRFQKKIALALCLGIEQYIDFIRQESHSYQIP